jgi:hypothetical protein
MGPGLGVFVLGAQGVSGRERCLGFRRGNGRAPVRVNQQWGHFFLPFLPFFFFRLT